MKEKTRRNTLLVLAAAVLAAVAAVLMLPSRAASPEADTQASADRVTVEEAAELLQTLSYTRCGHSVTRRLTAPVELYGQGLDETAALYPEWKITEFSPALVKMERELELFCPDHKVLLPDGAGYLCVFENKYGDALALVRELGIPVQNLPAAAREEVERGLGFDSSEELDAWLESVES